MTFESPFHFIVLRLLLWIFGAKGIQHTNRNPSNSSCGFHIHPNRLLLLMEIVFHFVSKSSKRWKFYCSIPSLKKIKYFCKNFLFWNEYHSNFVSFCQNFFPLVLSLFNRTLFSFKLSFILQRSIDRQRNRNDTSSFFKKSRACSCPFCPAHLAL